jgi:hypothetical protein
MVSPAGAGRPAGVLIADDGAVMTRDCSMIAVARVTGHRQRDRTPLHSGAAPRGTAQQSPARRRPAAGGLRLRQRRACGARSHLPSRQRCASPEQFTRLGTASAVPGSARARAPAATPAVAGADDTPHRLAAPELPGDPHGAHQSVLCWCLRVRLPAARARDPQRRALATALQLGRGGPSIIIRLPVWERYRQRRAAG